MRVLLLTGLSFALVACQQAAPQPEPRPEQVATEKPAAPVTPSPKPPAVFKPVSLSAKTDQFAVNVTFPAQAAAVPALAAIFERDFKQLKEDASKSARDTAEAGSEPFGVNECRGAAWWLVGDTARWLSLAAVSFWFSRGMAHPNNGFMSLLWDKQTKRVQPFVDLFTSPAALSAALRPIFCHELDRQRAERRGEPVLAGSDFSECLNPVDYSLVPVSADRSTLSAIDVLIPPYEAGPYAEGSYLVRLPITSEVFELVKPEYRSAFLISATLGAAPLPPVAFCVE